RTPERCVANHCRREFGVGPRSNTVLQHHLQTSVRVFWTKEFAAYPGLSQAPDYVDSGAPTVKLQFLFRPNLKFVRCWRAHNAGWHMTLTRVTGVPLTIHKPSSTAPSVSY